jgi:hypothetical protein
MPLYSPGRETEAQYRTSLEALCERIGVVPTTRRLCYHTMRPGFPPKRSQYGIYGHNRWGCAMGQDGKGLQVRFDHSVALRHASGAYLYLAQSYGWLDYFDGPRHAEDRLPDGILALHIGLAPYGHGAEGFLVGDRRLIERLAQENPGWAVTDGGPHDSYLYALQWSLGRVERLLAEGRVEEARPFVSSVRDLFECLAMTDEVPA